MAQWSRCCATNRKVPGLIPPGVIDIKSFRSHYGPGVDSASNRNEYQDYFLEGKGGRCIRPTNLTPSCGVVMKSGNLNFLEPCGPLQVCNGTDLPLPYCLTNARTATEAAEQCLPAIHTHTHTHTHEHITNNHIRTRSLLFLPLQTEQILTVQLKEQRLITYTNSPGTAVARWLRRFATNRKAAGSIQVSVT